MNFTREPIIETIVAPREGFRLLIRSSKQRGGDEFHVDAVEMVSFGTALFFRCLEKPKPFLLPVSDYEVLEVKEARVAIKGVQTEKSIKIGGGRDGSLRGAAKTEAVGESESATESERAEGRKDRRHRNKRRRGEKKEHPAAMEAESPEEAKAPSTRPTALVPPPPTLVSEKMSRKREDEPKSGDSSQEPPGGVDTGDTSTVQRVVADDAALPAPAFFSGLPPEGSAF